VVDIALAQLVRARILVHQIYGVLPRVKSEIPFLALERFVDLSLRQGRPLLV
jgi:hypothetical protein